MVPGFSTGLFIRFGHSRKLLFSLKSHTNKLSRFCQSALSSHMACESCLVLHDAQNVCALTKVGTVLKIVIIVIT